MSNLPSNLISLRSQAASTGAVGGVGVSAVNARVNTFDSVMSRLASKPLQPLSVKVINSNDSSEVYLRQDSCLQY
ncbi:hypothetical protein NQT62_05160 [Limnobacter humi]|uniref:Uncharacterized protein n=1 Tax=Limnobacter humi TaxID=1778671 RepID=A0ABT1WE76_9BURK|nr:hypothetical protein [Limnobacter humi]MCQ8895826.1 hypothetical protein [Limnobacter humi]